MSTYTRTGVSYNINEFDVTMHNQMLPITELSPGYYRSSFGQDNDLMIPLKLIIEPKDNYDTVQDFVDNCLADSKIILVAAQCVFNEFALSKLAYNYICIKDNNKYIISLPYKEIFGDLYTIAAKYTELHIYVCKLYSVKSCMLHMQYKNITNIEKRNDILKRADDVFMPIKLLDYAEGNNDFRRNMIIYSNGILHL